MMGELSAPVRSPSLTGVDLTEYPEELSRIKNARNITIRVVGTQKLEALNVRSNKGQKVVVSTIDEILSQFPISEIKSVFDSKNLRTIESALSQLLNATEIAPTLISGIIENEPLILSMVDAMFSVTDSTAMTLYCTFIARLIARDCNSLVDSDLIFNSQQLMMSYPVQMMNFYSMLTTGSQYARNALICMGVVDDVLDACLNSDDQEIAECASNTILCIINHPNEADYTDVHQFVEKIIEMLENKYDIVVANAIRSLTFIATKSMGITSVLYDHDVHKFLLTRIDHPAYTQICIGLTSRMALCESERLKDLIECGLLEKILSVSNPNFIGDIYCVISNCVESDPLTAYILLNNDLISNTIQVLGDSPYPVYKQISYFIATLLLYGPSDSISTIVASELMNPIIEMLASGVTRIIKRCLDALSRVLFLSNVDMVLNKFFDELVTTDEIFDNLESLLEHECSCIRSLSQSNLKELIELREGKK